MRCYETQLLLAGRQGQLRGRPGGGDQFLLAYPGMAAEARANRQFLARAIGYLVTEAGVRQFLDIGTGLPTADNTHEIVGRLMDRLPAGSYLMLQDGTTVSQANADALEDYNESGAIPYNLRTPEEIARYFDGLDVVEPGVIPIQQWRPEAAPAEPLADVNTFGGIGRKR
jgi:hypothetical protein